MKKQKKNLEKLTIPECIKIFESDRREIIKKINPSKRVKKMMDNEKFNHLSDFGLGEYIKSESEKIREIEIVINYLKEVLKTGKK